ncbi:MAG: site-2 protease family protein [Anaerolineae bacterium]|nr:site-2 protease family protein [Anaerolineae bacterium]
MSGSLSLGKVLGIPVRLHATWFLVAVLVTVSLAAGFFPQQYEGWSPMTYWLVGAVTTVLFFASVLLHELGHSVLALREKVPVKSITLFIFGGVAQIGAEPPTAGAEFRIAIAGPMVSFALAAIFTGLGAIVAGIESLSAPLAYLGRINLLLGAFNLIPGFPLDGGRVFRALVWQVRGSFRAATRLASRLGQIVAAGLILYGIAQFFFGAGLMGGLWYVFIGWFLNNAAQSSYQQVVLRDLLSGVKARNVMTQQCQTVPAGVPLDRLVEDNVLGQGQRCFFVADQGDLKGLITLHNIRRVAPSQRSELTADQVMTPANSVYQVHPEDDVMAVLQKMDESDVNQVPVVDGGRLLGLITRESLLHDIRLRAELAV